MGAGGMNGDSMGSIRDMLGIPDEFYEKVFRRIANKEAFGMVPVLLKPKSRGRVVIKSRNPFKWPSLQPNYMDHTDDVLAMLEGIDLLLSIADSKSLKRYGTRLYDVPLLGCEAEKFGSESYYKCCLKMYGSSLQHQSGTCKMGPDSDKDAVVDPQLNVYGVRGLRVADTSITPEIPAGHTNAVAIMIGEKVSDMIKSSWSS